MRSIISLFSHHFLMITHLVEEVNQNLPKIVGPKTANFVFFELTVSELIVFKIIQNCFVSESPTFKNAQDNFGGISVSVGFVIDCCPKFQFVVPFLLLFKYSKPEPKKQPLFRNIFEVQTSKSPNSGVLSSSKQRTYRAVFANPSVFEPFKGLVGL
jgi:hypothetical protein